MKTYLIILSLLGLTTAVAAQEVIPVSEADCRYFEKHVPDPDVAYTPGFDVNGKPVTPADLNAPQIELPEVVHFDLLVGLPLEAPLMPEGSLGKVSVNLETNEVSLNGRPLTSPQYQAVVAYCKER